RFVALFALGGQDIPCLHDLSNDARFVMLEDQENRPEPVTIDPQVYFPLHFEDAVNDVCITGTRLSQYQRYIRTERFAGRIDYLVGVARPSHPRIWANMETASCLPRKGTSPYSRGFRLCPPAGLARR